MSTHKKTPAPVATGNEGRKFTSLHDTERPKFYHVISHYDGDTAITKCRERLTQPAKFTTAPATFVECPLCRAAVDLQEVIW